MPQNLQDVTQDAISRGDVRKSRPGGIQLARYLIKALFLSVKYLNKSLRIDIRGFGLIAILLMSRDKHLRITVTLNKLWISFPRPTHKVQHEY